MTIKDYIYQFKGKLIVLIVLILLALIIYYAYSRYAQMMGEAKLVEARIEKKERTKKKTESKVEVLKVKNDYYVDVKGMVNKPGVYALPKNARVIDAITLAGGLLTDSDTSLINLSMKVIDGMVIKVYSKNEVKNIIKTKDEEARKNSLCTQNIINDACIDQKKEENRKVNINTASIESLMTLSGIGEAKAKAISEYRSKTPFKKIEDIMNVTGIGEALFAQISKDITL